MHLIGQVLHHMTLATEQLKHASINKEIMTKIENYFQEGLFFNVFFRVYIL